MRPEEPGHLFMLLHQPRDKVARPRITIFIGEFVNILAKEDDDILVILQQLSDKIAWVTGITPALEKAESRASLESPIVVASIQTLAREQRLTRFPRCHFDALRLPAANPSRRSAGLDCTLLVDGSLLAKTLLSNRNTAAFLCPEGCRTLRFHRHSGSALHTVVARVYLPPQ